MWVFTSNNIIKIHKIKKLIGGYNMNKRKYNLGVLRYICIILLLIIILIIVIKKWHSS